MEQIYPSISIPVKDVRLLLRRINKCIKDIDLSLQSSSLETIDPESLRSFSELIYLKAESKIREIKLRNGNENIFDELINQLNQQ